ncbi:hypothetical protein [Actinomadura miaoliensis]|uniref:Uncharacterized protein n=1 Tax=Actinomadura miaoliensis TaxID=430685 RepID=A0ABP7V941_9ACTN
MTHQIAPDTAGRTTVQPTHYHCYRWSGAGREWERMGRTDSLDVASPERPPVRTVDWLIKSSQFIAAVHTDPAGARDWLIAEWDAACEKSLYAVPEWVSSQERAVRALRAIETGCWPSYSQWMVNGVVVFLSVVGTADRCH